MRPSIRIQGNVIRLVPRSHARSVKRVPVVGRVEAAAWVLLLVAILACIVSCSPNASRPTVAPAPARPAPFPSQGQGAVSFLAANEGRRA